VSFKIGRLGAAFGLGELELGELGVYLLPHHLLHEPVRIAFKTKFGSSFGVDLAGAS
jgi:hypothetical protein